jgi:hypothetical protein
MIRKTIFSLIIFSISMTINAQEKFKIFKENQESENPFGINQYSFVHHICPDSFFMMDLDKELDYDEMALIVRQIYNGVTLKDKVQLIYEQTEPTTGRVTYFTKDDEQKGIMFIMLTNFNKATRKFDVKPDPNDQLARWYFIKNDRLIYRKDLFSSEIEQTKIASDRKSDLIKYYLFDDNPENDNQIKPLIDKILESGDNGPDNYFAQIYLIQFYLMNGDIIDAGNSLKELDDYFYLNTEIPRNQKIYLKMVKAEYEVMSRM